MPETWHQPRLNQLNVTVMTVQEIKAAVDNGKTVHWSNDSYTVIKSNEEYLIKCESNEHYIGLTWADGVTMNGKEKDFYIHQSECITITLPTYEDVEFTIECQSEYSPIKGNAIASGDDEYDRQVEEQIAKDFDNGNEWAWCTVKTTASWRGFKGVDYLGCCSYESKQAFMSDGYYETAKSQAFDDLIKNIKENADKEESKG
jgi:hypothetical protein